MNKRWLLEKKLGNTEANNSHFYDHGMENVLGKHSNNETNQVLTISLMSTNVPQYKTSISIVIYHSCLQI